MTGYEINRDVPKFWRTDNEAFFTHSEHVWEMREQEKTRNNDRI